MKRPFSRHVRLMLAAIVARRSALRQGGYLLVEIYARPRHAMTETNFRLR